MQLHYENILRHYVQRLCKVTHYFYVFFNLKTYNVYIHFALAYLKILNCLVASYTTLP